MAPLIHIIRHAQPVNINPIDNNKNPNVVDPDLSAIGVGQCATLKASIQGIRIRTRLLFCSPSLRAISTAKRVFSGEFGDASMKIILLPYLIEVQDLICNYPATTDDIVAAHGDVVDVSHLPMNDAHCYRTDDTVFAPTVAATQSRARLCRNYIRQLIQELPDAESAEVVIVGHGAFNRKFLTGRQLSDRPGYAQLRSWRFQNWTGNGHTDAEANFVAVDDEEVRAMDSMYRAPGAADDNPWPTALADAGLGDLVAGDDGDEPMMFGFEEHDDTRLTDAEARSLFVDRAGLGSMPWGVGGHGTALGGTGLGIRFDDDDAGEYHPMEMDEDDEVVEPSADDHVATGADATPRLAPPLGRAPPTGLTPPPGLAPPPGLTPPTGLAPPPAFVYAGTPEDGIPFFTKLPGTPSPVRPPLPLSQRRLLASQDEPRYDPTRIQVVDSRFSDMIKLRARQVQRYTEEHGHNRLLTLTVIAQAEALEPPLSKNPLKFAEDDTEENWPPFFHSRRSVEAWLNFHWYANGRWDGWDEHLGQAAAARLSSVFRH